MSIDKLVEEIKEHEDPSAGLVLVNHTPVVPIDTMVYENLNNLCAEVSLSPLTFSGKANYTEAPSKYDEYLYDYGPINNPNKLTDFYIHTGRQQGKTFAMIKSLPDSPCIIVLHSKSYEKTIIELIQNVRPGYNMKNIEFVSYSGNYLAALNSLKGYGPIFFDNAVLDMIISDQVNHINNVYYEYLNEKKPKRSSN